MLRTTLLLSHTHPWVTFLTLALLALIIQVVVDVVLGDVAEYFNAARVLLAWRELLSDNDPQAVSFMASQRELGPLALPIGTAILVVQPLVYGALALLAMRLLHRIV